MLGGVLVVCGECYNLGKIDRSVVVLSHHLSILFFKSPKIQGMSSSCNGNHFSSIA